MFYKLKKLGFKLNCNISRCGVQIDVFPLWTMLIRCLFWSDHSSCNQYEAIYLFLIQESKCNWYELISYSEDSSVKKCEATDCSELKTAAIISLRPLVALIL
jgi:hypothetical protein